MTGHKKNPKKEKGSKVSKAKKEKKEKREKHHKKEKKKGKRSKSPAPHTKASKNKKGKTGKAGKTPVKKVKRAATPIKSPKEQKVAPQIEKKPSGSLHVEKTQFSEEEKKKQEVKEVKEAPEPTKAETPKKTKSASKTSTSQLTNLYKILDGVSDSASTENPATTKSKLSEPPKSGEPERIKSLKEILEKKKSLELNKTQSITLTPRSSAENCERPLKKDKKRKEITPSPELKTPDAIGPPLVEMSPEVQKTQSDGSLDAANLIAPIRTGPPSKTTLVDPKNVKKDGDLPMESPPKEEESLKVVKDVLRSDLDQPAREIDFVRNHGDTLEVLSMKKVDCDLIGRTGMYMERYGMGAEKKKAFDWIAYNRHDMTNKQTQFSQCLSIALSDVGITKPLLQKTISFLKLHGQISGAEHDVVLKEVEKLGDFVSFSKTSSLLQTHCETYRQKPGKK